MSNLRYIACLLAFILFMYPTPGKAAQAGLYAANDLLLFFQNPAGTTGTDKVVYFNLGSTFNVFRDAATPGSAAFGSTIPLGNINTILTSTYGADWTSLSSSIFLAATGQNGSTSATSTGTSNGDFARTVYITKPRTSAGSVGQANSSSPLYPPSQTAVAGQINGANNINGMTQPGAVLADGTATTGNTLLDDYNPFFNGNPATAYGAINGGLMGFVTNSSYTFGSVSRVVSALDLYRVAKTSGTGTTSASIWHNANNIAATFSNDFGVAGGGSAAAYYLGTITLSSDGSVNFVARQAEPVIALTGDDLTGMTTTQGAASTHRNLTITASNVGTSNLSIALPPGFEVSTNGGASYATTGTIAPTSGAVNATVRVRIAATATQGNLGGDVTVSAGSKSETKPISGTVGASAPSVAISGTFSGFTTTAGTPSAAQTFSVSGSNLTGNLSVTAPSGFELRRAGSGSYGSSTTISPVSGTVAATSMEIRIAAATPAGFLTGGVITVASTGATSATLSVSGTVNAAPSLIVSPASLSGFSATQGTASAAQTFTVSGANLTGNVTVTAPTGFEVSNGGGSYAGSLTLTRSGSTLASTLISVRIAAAASVGSPSGNITVSSGGASSKTVGVSGTVVPPPAITVTGTLAAFTATQGTASAAQTFTVSGANLTGNVTITAPANFEVSTDGTNFFTSRTLTRSGGSVASTSISVRIAASAPNGPVSGIVRIGSAGAGERTLVASGVVGSQPAVAVVSDLSVFAATQGTVSPAQTFTLSGANLTGDVTVQAPANFEVSTDGSSFFASRALTPSGGSVASTTIYVRLAATAPVGPVSGNITVSSTGATNQTVSLSGTVVPPPSITTTGTLAAFSTTAGTASVPQTFTVSGANLTGDVTVTAPSGFELSSGGGSYAGGLTLTPSAGTLASTTVSVRLSAAAAVGSPSGSITLSSSGASSKTVAVSGTVVPAPSLSTLGTLTSFSTTEGAASAAQSFTVSGSNLNGNVTVTAPSNFQVSLNGRTFASNVSLAPSGGSVSRTISVRVAASASPGPVAGNVNVAAAGAVGRTVAVTGTVAVRPRIDVTGSLTSFSTSANLASSEQTLVIGGSNLTGDITVTAPARYEVSVGGGASFATSVTLTPASGSVNRNISVRLAAAPAGSYTGDLSFSSPGAAARAVLLSGVVTPPPTITTTGSFGSFATTVGAPSTRQSFSASGANLAADLLITAPSGYEISTDGRSYGPSLTVVRRAGSASARVFVRIAAATPVGSPSGVITLSSAGASERTLPVSGSVVPRPSISVAGDLRPFATVVGRASSSQVVMVAGSALVGPVIVTAPRGYEVAGQRKAFARSISLSSSRGVLNEQIMIRLSRSTKAAHPRGEVKVTTTGASPLLMAVQGQVSAVPSVSLTGSPKAFTTARGRPSASQVVRVSGKDLKSVVSVTAPSGFQVSANGKNFSSRVQFTPKGGTVTNQRVWIRVEHGPRARILGGSVTASSSGAKTRIIRVSGRIR